MIIVFEDMILDLNDVYVKVKAVYKTQNKNILHRSIPLKPVI